MHASPFDMRFGAAGFDDGTDGHEGLLKRDGAEDGRYGPRAKAQLRPDAVHGCTQKAAATPSDAAGLASRPSAPPAAARARRPPSRGEDHAVVLRRLAPFSAAHRPPASWGPAAARPSRTSPASPGPRAQVQRAVKRQIVADIGRRILLQRGLGVQRVDRGQPVDQREMRARQRPRRHLRSRRARIDASSSIRSGLSSGSRRAPTRNRQRPFRHQPPDRLARRVIDTPCSLASPRSVRGCPGGTSPCASPAGAGCGTAAHARQRSVGQAGRDRHGKTQSPREGAVNPPPPPCGKAHGMKRLAMRVSASAAPSRLPFRNRRTPRPRMRASGSSRARCATSCAAT